MLTTELSLLADTAVNSTKDAAQAVSLAQDVERRMRALARDLDTVTRHALSLEHDHAELQDECARLREECARLRAHLCGAEHPAGHQDRT